MKMTKVNGKVKGVFVLVAVLAVDCLGVFLFASGFFLTRLELDLQSSCGSVPTLNASDVAPERDHWCWTSQKPRFQRVVLVVIDALKYEFAEWREDLGLEQERPFDNRLPVVDSLLKRRPLQTLLVPFYADPPTTTLQRLKGLTTGGFPTFLEMKDDFDSHGMEITEDNVLDLLLRANKSLVFMGDDTWMALYPNQFKRAFPFPSFNVKDLHTVDNGVVSHLSEEMMKDDWDVIIAHFLGVDHVGHRYGPFHPAMKEKLMQMDQVLESMVKLMDEEAMEDTILFVFGDHGMTDDGNHGGASEEEVGAALFIYSPTPLAHPNGGDVSESAAQQQAMSKMVNELYDPEEPMHARKSNIHPIVQQIDLAPTLALLLGLPVPYSSLGVMIPELFLWHEAERGSSSYLDRLRNLNEALRVNVAQVFRYLRTYSEQTSSSIESATIDSLQEEVATVYEQLDLLEHHGGSEEALLQMHLHAHRVGRKSLRLASEEGRRIWTTFNLPLMIVGLLVCVAGAAIRMAFLVHTHAVTLRSLCQPAVGLLVVELCGLFSNSFIEAEHQVTMFVTVTLAVGLFIRSYSRGGSYQVSLACATIACTARICVVLGQEQWHRGQELIPGDFHQPWTWIHTFLPSLALGALAWKTLGKGLHGGLFVVQIVLMLGYWVVQSLVKLDRSDYRALHMYSARAIFVLSVVGFFMGYASKGNTLHVLFFLPSFMLLTGPSSALVCALVLIQCYCLRILVAANKVDSVTKSFVWLNMLLQAFYATGHECKIAKLHIGSAYVGFEEFDKNRSGFFLALNTLASHIMFVLGLPILAYPKGSTSKEVLYLTLLVSLRAIATTLFVTLERRHLMVWAIFAPKFAFDAIILLVVDALCILSSLMN